MGQNEGSADTTVRGLVLVLQTVTLQSQGKEPGQTALGKNTWGKTIWMMPLEMDNRD